MEKWFLWFAGISCLRAGLWINAFDGLLELAV